MVGLRPALQAENENKRPLLEAQQIERGQILSSDGEVIADSKQKGRGESIRYIRSYPQGSLFGNPVGFSFITQGNSGLERSENDTLVGIENEFVSCSIRSADRQRRAPTRQHPDAATSARDRLPRGTESGAVVAIEPQTGAVRVMASTPGYDPNLIPTDSKELNAADPPALLDRTVQSVYPPGSTMKVVTAAAALDSGEFTPETTLDASSPQEFSGVDLANAGGESFGTIDMRTALTNSVNTYWAQVGEALGPETLVEYMKRFGFFKDPEVQLPDDQKAPSGVYAFDKDGNELVESGFDIARVAIAGRERASSGDADADGGGSPQPCERRHADAQTLVKESRTRGRVTKSASGGAERVMTRSPPRSSPR